VWYIQHTTSKVNLYQCPHGADTPPIDDWGVTVYGEGQPPRIKCLKPPTHNHLFLHLALEELVAVDKYVCRCWFRKPLFVPQLAGRWFHLRVSI
jgi:hypothetical protein